uniref:Uncharacterized protein n=1 Tax=Acrobeloides nanus TaxID=290746 RepID=A0A914DWQ9_9BILA
MKSKFCSKSTALEVVKDVDLSEKSILITGTTAGIGLETARVLALKGAHVIMANRNVKLSEEVRDNIYKETPNRKIDILQVDLSSLKSVQQAAKEFIVKKWPLHVLILNAGVITPSIKTSVDGYEASFAINYLAHFYLTYLLLEKLRESAPSRLVMVSSNLNSKSGTVYKLNPTDSLEIILAKLIQKGDSSDSGISLYNYSKLCSTLLAFKLDRLENKNGIHTYALHPGGIMGTNHGKSFFGEIPAKIISFVAKPFAKSVEQGAATTVYCAASPDVEKDSGKYYEDCHEDESNLHKELTRNEILQDALWQKSMEIIQNFEQSQQ